MSVSITFDIGYSVSTFGVMIVSLVFQYGSNMLCNRINCPSRLKGHAQRVGIAYTADRFELVFDIWSKANCCAAADIVRGSGRNIWGVLYKIPQRLIDRHKSGSCKSLDEIEGECTNYKRVPIGVILPDGTRRSGVWTYIGKNRKKWIQTSCEYVKYVMHGLRENNKIPNDYVEYVKRQIINNNPGLESQINKL